MLYFFPALVGCLIVQQINAHFVIRENDLVISYHGVTHTTCDAEENRIQSFVAHKVLDCVIECALREHCQVLNYLRAYKLCELYQINVIASIITGNCFRIQKEYIQIKEYPCAELCRNGTSCDRKTKTCQIKECLEVPQLPNGRIRGNLRAVGNRIKYECDVGFILLNTFNDVARCLEDGKWSTQGQCVTVPAVGNLCSETNCNHHTVHCVDRDDTGTETYCHCAFGYEFNEELGICEQVCNEYATNHLYFQRQEGVFILDYNYGMDYPISTFEACVAFCNDAYPYYLSIDFFPKVSECYCGSVSEQQFAFTHGDKDTERYSEFYNRPCSIPV